MKKLLLITILFLSTLSASAQNCETLEDCNQKLSEAAQMVQKLLDIKKADDKAFIDSQAEKTALKITIAELERAKQTPCTVAAEKVKIDLTYWVEKLTGDKTKDKEVLKILKDVRASGRKAIASQCGFNAPSVWKTVWDAAKIVIPVGAIILAK